MADFDMVRDRTLLFFLDHLMEKGQQRTLHDLSCQFGAKGFTKEMRQIAGGSQSGLRKFLSQFPSLFSIDGDTVFITPLNSEKIATRDYTRETIEFFSNKLMSYGNAEVPIKSLFGHRSQASAEVRHVSGQNVREFSDFLVGQSHVFVLRNEYVVLKSVLDNLGSDEASELKRMPEEAPIDPYLMKQLVMNLETSLLELSMKSCKVAIEVLFNSISDHCDKENGPDIWQTVVKSAQDLMVFLHMNSRIFTVQGQYVSLTPEREEELKEKRSTATSKPETPRILVNGSSAKTPVNTTISSAAPTATTTTRTATSSPTALSSQQQQAPAPQPQQQQQQQPPQQPATKTAKPHTPVRTIRSQILKVVSDNLQNGKNSPSTFNGDHQQQTSHVTNANHQQQCPEGFDMLDVNVLKPRIVVSTKESNEIIDEITKSSSEVGLDVEGINLGLTGGSCGEVTLVQLSISHTKLRIPKIFLFDVLLNRSLLETGGSLRALLESEKIVKIAHDVRNVSACLNRNFGITLNAVFDTQVAHLVLQQQTTGKPAYKPTKYISLFTLSQIYGGPNLNPKMKDRLHKIYKKDANFWQRRPLTEEMIQFALTDVYTLLPVVYGAIRDKLLPEYEPLLEQLTYEAVFNHINSDEIKQIKKQRKFELELTDLKLKLFNNDKKKIVLSNREIRLLRYIDLTDEIRDKIEGPQNVAKKLKRFDTKSKSTEVDGDNLMRKNGDINGENNTLQLPGISGHDLSDDGENDDYEDESIGSSLKSNEFASNSTDDSLFSGRNPRSLCWDYFDGVKPTELHLPKVPLPLKMDAATQTLSTGDIVITKIHFEGPVNEPV